MTKRKKFPTAPVRPDQGIHVDGRLIGNLSAAVVLILGFCMWLAGSMTSALVLGILGVAGFIATPLLLRGKQASKPSRKKLRP